MIYGNVNNLNLSADQQNYLATTGSDDVKCTLAKNPIIVKAVQELLVEDDTKIRKALACNPALCAEYIDELMDDTSTDVIISLAGNSALTNEMQMQIATNYSKDIPILQSLAQNPNLSAELMKKFISSDSYDSYDNEVKAGLASNRSLPEAMQAKLIKFAKESRNVEKIKINLASNPVLKIAQQAELAQDRSVDVRVALYNNPSLDMSVKKRVISSFSQLDIDFAKRDLERNEDRRREASEEIQKCSLKSWDISGGFYFSESSRQSAADSNRSSWEYAEKKERDARHEIKRLEITLRVLKEALAQQVS